MSVLKIHLFGRFRVSRGERPAEGFDAHKEQELLSYLLLRRGRPHAREALAGLLWGEVPTEKSKKYLRQALWHVQAALDPVQGGEPGGVLAVEHDWVQLDAGAAVWLDVEVFERTFMRVHDSRGAELDGPSFGALQEAVGLYRGDLLEGWYQDWCLFERERLQNMYLAMLDKLMSYCEAHRLFELGVLYGAAVLRLDRAHERTHRQLMTLQYLAGDRTAALRQFERCAAALEEELGVKPDRLTAALYQNIRADHTAPAAPSAATADPAHVTLADLLGHLKQIQTTLAELQGRPRKDLNDPAN
jgi:DNA-binding SARP family transcriptional activator